MNSSSNLRRIIGATASAVVLISCGGCYLLDSARGQLSLMARREPISRVIEDPSTPATLRAQLESVTTIRNFASRQLALPDNGSYRSYADVGRPYVVWNVVAAPEFSTDARQWCYPIVGCVAYRGYFAEAKARAFADSLHARGLDVSVSGVAAYSTLGHFDDPILNTMVGWDDVELAAIVFHELTHQLLYVAGDASFNEALATTVEEEGVRRWLLAQGRSADLERHQEQEGHYVAVVSLLRQARDQLHELYASPVDADTLRRRKAERFAQLRADYAHLTAGWAEHPPFESWFRGDLNNAHLASVATYYDCVPGLQRELAAVHGDLPQFYARVRALAALEQVRRDAAVCSRV